MTIAIEPMVTMGRRDVDLLDDGWTVVTAMMDYRRHILSTRLR